MDLYYLLNKSLFKQQINIDMSLNVEKRWNDFKIYSIISIFMAKKKVPVMGL